MDTHEERGTALMPHPVNFIGAPGPTRTGDLRIRGQPFEKSDSPSKFNYL
jgi:hypothetical protein